MPELVCSRCKKSAPGLPAPPWGGAQGQEIFENACLSCWKEWQLMQVKVLNEFHLNLSDASHAARLDHHMMVFLGLEEPSDEAMAPAPYGFGAQESPGEGE